jgi:hypothetical protein
LVWRPASSATAFWENRALISANPAVSGGD